MESSSKSIEKAIGLPSDMDFEHQYIYSTGYYDVQSYWWVDKAGNYIRYTNADPKHKDFNPKLGDPLVHPEQPLPTTSPEFFTEDGFKRSQAIASSLIPRRNPNYDPRNPKELWFEVVESKGLTRYVYLDADLRENIDLWVQYQLRLADAGMLQYRKYAFDLFKGKHPLDRVLGAVLMLVDQGLFSPEMLISATVADLTFADQTVILAGKKIGCDDAFLDFLTSLTQGRVPEDPLFVLQTAHGRNALGQNMVYSVFDALKMDPAYLMVWHANHMFSRILHRMAAEKVPVETAGVQVFEELANALGTSDDVSFLVDAKVRSTLMENYVESTEVSKPADQPTSAEEAVEQAVAKSLYFEVQDRFGVPMIFSDLVERRGDELQFSIWLHSEPMHDISPAEQADIDEAMAEHAEEDDAENPQEAGSEGQDEGANPKTNKPPTATEGSNVA